MRISPDDVVFFEYGFVKLNLTIVTTWVLMGIMVIGSLVVSRKIKAGTKVTRWQSVLEMIVTSIKQQIEEVGLQRAQRYLAFLGTLFLFLLISNLLTILPIYEPPTSSLSTTAALAISVFFAVPFFNITEHGILNYLKSYVKPLPIMLPFHIISEFSRTLALAVRLFGNMMSGVMIIGILLTITPLIFPIVMTAFGLLTGSGRSESGTLPLSVLVEPRPWCPALSGHVPSLDAFGTGFLVLPEHGVAAPGAVGSRRNPAARNQALHQDEPLHPGCHLPADVGVPGTGPPAHPAAGGQPADDRGRARRALDSHVSDPPPHRHDHGPPLENQGSHPLQRLRGVVRGSGAVGSQRHQHTV